MSDHIHNDDAAWVNAALRALKPFAEMYEAAYHLHHQRDDYLVYGSINFAQITVGDLRRAYWARALLAKS